MSQPSPSHIRATAVCVATLRRLALSVLFTTTIATTSYQTTCTISKRTFNKRQHANARYRVESLTHHALRHGGSSDTALKEEYRVDVSQCQLLEKKAGEGKAAKAARHLFGPPAAPVQGKNLGSDQPGEPGSCGNIVLITYGEGGQDNCIQGTIIASTAEPSGTN